MDSIDSSPELSDVCFGITVWTLPGQLFLWLAQMQLDVREQVRANNRNPKPLTRQFSFVGVSLPDHYLAGRDLAGGRSGGLGCQQTYVITI